MKRVNARAVYTGTLVAILGAVAGFSLATVAITSSTQSGQANYVSAGGAVTGLTFTSAVLGSVGLLAPSASSGTASSPQALIIGTNTFCVSASCTSGHVEETVTYSFTTSFAGAILITVTTSATGGGSGTVYLAQATIAVSGSIALVWDYGTSTGTITSITATAQQCSGSTCP